MSFLGRLFGGKKVGRGSGKGCLEVERVETAAMESGTAFRSVPRAFQFALPLHGWSVTAPSPATGELFLATKPGIRASVKEFSTDAAPADDKAWLALWEQLDGLLLLPGAEIESTRVLTRAGGILVLERIGRKRSPTSPTELLPDVVQQYVTTRNLQGHQLFFVLLASLGQPQGDDEYREVFLNHVECFSVLEAVAR